MPVHCNVPNGAPCHFEASLKSGCKAPSLLVGHEVVRLAIAAHGQACQKPSPAHSSVCCSGASCFLCCGFAIDGDCSVCLLAMSSWYTSCHVSPMPCSFCCVPWLCLGVEVCVAQVMLWSWQQHWLASLRQEGLVWYAPLPLWWNTWGRAPSRVPWQEKQILFKGLSSECSLPWMLPRLDAVPAAVHAIAASALLYNEVPLLFNIEHANNTKTSMLMRRLTVAVNQANTRLSASAFHVGRGLHCNSFQECCMTFSGI